MSKSLGNTITMRELLEDGIEPAAIRHQLMSAQYRRELNFTRDSLEASGATIQRLLDFEARLNETEASGGADDGAPRRIAEEAVDAFREAMDDDLNSAEALAALFVFVNRANSELDAADGISEGDLTAAREALASMDQVLGLLAVAREGRQVDEDVEAWVESLIEERNAARESRGLPARGCHQERAGGEENRLGGLGSRDALEDHAMNDCQGRGLSMFLSMFGCDNASFRSGALATRPRTG